MKNLQEQRIPRIRKKKKVSSVIFQYKIRGKFSHKVKTNYQKDINNSISEYILQNRNPEQKMNNLFNKSLVTNLPKGFSLVELMLVIFLIGIISLTIVKLTTNIRENDLAYDKLSDAQVAAISALETIKEHARRTDEYSVYLQQDYESYHNNGTSIVISNCITGNYHKYCDYYTKPRMNCMSGYAVMGGADVECRIDPKNSLFRRLNVNILSENPKLVKFTVGIFPKEASNKLLYEHSVIVTY